MKRLLGLLLIVFLLASPLSSISQEKPSWSVYFSPHGGCTEAIVKELGQAKSLHTRYGLFIHFHGNRKSPAGCA